MKAVLEFNLRDKEEREAHLRCVKSLDMASVLFEFSLNSRKKIAQKIYDNKSNNVTPLDIVYEKFDAIMEANGININELIT